MTDKWEFIDLNEARDLGVIQEINRRLLHPRGLALAIEYNHQTGEVDEIVGIYDFRDDEEGMFFGDVNEDKVEKFDSLLKEEGRKKGLGFVVQPVDFDLEEWENRDVS